MGNLKVAYSESATAEGGRPEQDGASQRSRRMRAGQSQRQYVKDARAMTATTCPPTLGDGVDQSRGGSGERVHSSLCLYCVCKASRKQDCRQHAAMHDGALSFSVA